MCPPPIKGMDTVTAVERNRTVHARNLLNSTKGNSPRPCVRAPCLPSRLIRSRLPLRAGLRPALTASTAQASESRDAGSGGNRLPLMPCGLALKSMKYGSPSYLRLDSPKTARSLQSVQHCKGMVRERQRGIQSAV